MNDFVTPTGTPSSPTATVTITSWAPGTSLPVVFWSSAMSHVPVPVGFGKPAVTMVFNPTFRMRYFTARPLVGCPDTVVWTAISVAKPGTTSGMLPTVTDGTTCARNWSQ